jgi:hypothetical protein
MRRSWIVLLILAACAGTMPAHGQALDMGLPELNALNPGITGSGVVVAQAEALFGGTDNYEVDPAGVGQSASKFTYIGLDGSVTTTYNSADGSGHAEAVANNFYGQYGMAPGVSQIDNYEADYFVNNIVSDDVAIPAEIVNQSFAFVTGTNTPEQSQAEEIYDDYSANYRTLFISGVGDGGAVLAPASAYNGIAVGAYEGASSTGPTYDGRSKPDIVAPASASSYACGYVSGAAALLLQAAQADDAGAAAASDAADPRVIKVMLLNGAEKPPGWVHTDTAPLDPNYGAGVLNVYNSYLNLVAGEHHASASVAGLVTPLSTGTILPDEGWDFSGITTSLSQGNYTIESNHYLFDLDAATAPEFTLTSTLTWFRQYGQTDINNLYLFLYDTTTNTEIALSDSTVDNVQELYVQDLQPGDYDLVVEKAGGTSINSGGSVVSGSDTYALAYNFAPVPEPSVSWLAAPGLLLCAGRAMWRKRQRRG